MPQTRTDKCEIHGAFEAKCFVGASWTRCPTCSADEDVKDKAQREVQERDDRRQAWQRRIGEAGIPERFQNRSLLSFIAESEAQARALQFATDYADRFDQALTTGRSALFLGKPGTGKTHLAVGIGLRIMHRDSRTVLFTTVIRAIRRVKDTWNRESTESETQAIAALAFPDLLILDEVGVQFGSDAEKLILFDVLNERYERRRPTLLLSNLALDDVKAYLGERVFDRLREDGGEAIPFDWASWRGRIAA
ncbi:MAG: ATP-binding protein [Propionivibrio sp.]|nr:ATP-binding protein [Propionivibrio sp.]